MMMPKIFVAAWTTLRTTHVHPQARSAPIRVSRLFSSAGNMKEEANLDWPERLQDVLDACEPLGTFATASHIKSIVFPLPMVAVEGVGNLSFPLMDLAVEPLKAMSNKATLRVGAGTIQDGTVRKDWRIDASHVTLGGGDEWEELLKSIVNTACRSLGLSDDRISDLGIRATFKELLLQEADGSFNSHTDKEKEIETFGTLAIQLPSQFTGGELSVWHGGQTMCFDLANQCAEQFKLIAFYANCEHQLDALTSGTRICLVFNLVSIPAVSLPKKIVEPPTPMINVITESSLQSIADEWATMEDGVTRLGYPLKSEHYTPKTLIFDGLTGRDSIVVQTLLNAKCTKGQPLFHVHLLLMEHYVDKVIGGMFTEWNADDVFATKVLDRNGKAVPNSRDLYEWTMYLCDDGWMKPAEWIEEHEEELYGEEEEERKHLMFDDWPTKGEAEMVPKYCPGRVQEWYYAAAVVISPTAKRDDRDDE
jgi:hypothetical protein